MTRRYLSWAPLVAAGVLPLGAVQANEAEQLFRAMEARIASARMIESSYKTSYAGSTRGEVHGTYLQEGSRFRMTLEGTLAGKPTQVLRVSNGARMKYIHREGIVRVEEDTPPGFADDLKAIATYMGLATAVISPARASSREPLFRAKDCKMGARERVGERDTQVIHYTLEPAEGQEVRTAATLWLDPQTGLPLRRVMVLRGKEQETTITETVVGLKLDSPIDPARFELPR